MALAIGDADAARLGGGRSMGSQRQSIAPQKTTPPASAPSSNATADKPVMPAQPNAVPARPATPTPAPSGMSRWLGPIAGIAAGLGLAALLSHFGLPEGMGSFLLLALLAIGGFFIIRMLFARRTASPAAPMQYAGAGRTLDEPARSGVDSPAWGGGGRVEPVMTTNPAAADGAPAKRIPPGFDVEGFARQAKQQFVRLQAAWDAGDLRALGEVMTPDMLAEMRRDLGTRGEHRATEIVTLEAEVLEVVTEGDRHWASVRYSGLLREGGEPVPKPIDEVWNLSKPVDDSSGWLLAGIQQFA